MGGQYVDTHALVRAIRTVSHGTIESLEARRAALGYDALQEIDCQLQIPIHGVASSGSGWATFDVGFDVDFVFASEQRDSPFTVPHFYPGAVVLGEPSPLGATADTGNPDSLVMVTCAVVRWATDRTRSVITGASMQSCATTLGGNDVAYDGYLHLTFQGFGAVPENDIPQLDVGQ